MNTALRQGSPATLLLAVLLLVSSGCQPDTAGTLSLSLQSTSPGGTTYRLVTARFDVASPTGLLRTLRDDGPVEELTLDVEPGLANGVDLLA